MFLIFFRNILCPKQMFLSLRSPRNIIGNNVSSFARAFRENPGCKKTLIKMGFKDDFQSAVRTVESLFAFFVLFHVGYHNM